VEKEFRSKWRIEVSETISQLLDRIDSALTRPETRWEAATQLGEWTKESSSAVWGLILKHGSSDDEDLRFAIATCVLEHLLEYHFEQYFPLLESEIRGGNLNLGKTLRLCWKFGQAEFPSNTNRWDRLVKSL
jgi:hypothetical protein